MSNPKIAKLRPQAVSKLSPRSSERKVDLNSRLLDYWANHCANEAGDEAAIEMVMEEASVSREKAGRYMTRLARKANFGEIPTHEPWEGDEEMALKTPLHLALDDGWRDHAYPLQVIDLHVQGTRHNSRHGMIELLETAVERLRAGEDVGGEHDDDLGYRFKYRDDLTGGSVFKGNTGRW